MTMATTHRLPPPPQRTVAPRTYWDQVMGLTSLATVPSLSPLTVLSLPRPLLRGGTRSSRSVACLCTEPEVAR